MADKIVVSYFKEKKHVRLTGAAYRKFAESIMDRDGWQCAHCGSYENLTVSHIIHRGMGGGRGPGDVIDNAITACMKCHDKEERNLDGFKKK